MKLLSIYYAQHKSGLSFGWKKRRLSHHGAHALLKPKSGDFKNNEVTWAPAAQRLPMGIMYPLNPCYF